MLSYKIFNSTFLKSNKNHIHTYIYKYVHIHILFENKLIRRPCRNCLQQTESITSFHLKNRGFFGFQKSNQPLKQQIVDLNLRKHPILFILFSQSMNALK